jgi:hypothetical protein
LLHVTHTKRTGRMKWDNVGRLVYRCEVGFVDSTRGIGARPYILGELDATLVSVSGKHVPITDLQFLHEISQI